MSASLTHGRSRQHRGSVSHASPSAGVARASAQLLARLLDAPDFPAKVARLEAPVLARLIDRIGLEDAGEIVACATAAQLAHIFDEALWTSDRPGEDPRFDGRRFVVWLEIMLEAGDVELARRLAELPEDLLTLAFHEQVLVFRTEDLLIEMRELDEREANAIEKALANCLSEELDEYQLVSRQPDGWDAVIGAIVALDRDHHDAVVRLLDRCVHLSAGRVEDEGGLYEVLSESESLHDDVAGDRDDRRAEAGYVAPSAATAFLALARLSVDVGDPAERGAARLRRSVDVGDPAERSAARLRRSVDVRTKRDPLTSAYFRRLVPTATFPAQGAHAQPADAAWLQLVEGDDGDDGGLQHAHARLAEGGEPERDSLLARGLRELAGIDPAALARRSEEIAYLANVLAAGSTLAGRRLRPIEATRAALTLCNLGLVLCTRRRTVGQAVSVLRDETRSTDILFRLAYAHLQPAVASSAGAREEVNELEEILAAAERELQRRR